MLRRNRSFVRKETDRGQGWKPAPVVVWLLASLFLGAGGGVAQPSQSAQQGVIRSQRLLNGVPLGGIGCGTFQLLTDGTISQATINNNRDHPIGDLPGCFAALWTDAGGRKLSRVLSLQNAYQLPAISAIEYRGLFPQAFLEYPDPALPVRLSLRAFSPLIPADLKNSSLPVALFVFTLKNESRAPVEASLVFSWENFLGVGGSAARGAFSDRNGNSVKPLPSRNGQFGLLLDSLALPAVLPANRLVYNARGNYALMTQPAIPEAKVMTAGWNAREAKPAWWEEFQREGTISGTVGAGEEGRVHPAGAVCVKIALKERETREIPFVIAWHTPRHYTITDAQYGHFYEKSFADAAEVARYALENRLFLATLTEEWQNRLLRSTLPEWLMRQVINDSSALFTHTVLTRDGGGGGAKPGEPLFALLESPVEGQGRLGSLDRRLFAQPMLSVFFPAMERQELRHYAATQAPSGAISRYYGNLDEQLVQGVPAVNLTPETPSPRAPDTSLSALTAPSSSQTPFRIREVGVVAAYLYQVYRHYLWTGDQRFLDERYPSARRALEYLAVQTRNGEILTLSGASGGEDDPFDRAPGYQAALWLASLRMMERMAAAMQDRRFAAQCASWFETAQDRIRGGFWNGRFLNLYPLSESRQVCFAAILAGVWMADTLEAGDALPDEIVEKTTEELLILNDRASPFGPALAVDREGKPAGEPYLWLPQAITYQASLYTLRGRAAEGLTLAQRLQSAALERARAPFPSPERLRLEDGSRAGAGASLSSPASWHFMNALLGFSLDLPQGRLILTPRLPAGQRALSAPLFAPTFWAWLEYRPGPTRTILSFRLDRTTPIAVSQELIQSGAGLTLQKVTLPNIGLAAPQITASLARAPVSGKAGRDSRGNLVFTFDTPLRIDSGQRLEFVIRMRE